MAQIYDGLVNGTVELTDTQIIIRRKGVLGFLTQGLKGEKRIPYSSVTSVQFKAAGLTNGYIQFGVAGGKESTGGVFAATSDENTVMFRRKAGDQFLHLRDAVERRADQARHGGNAAVPKTSAISELAQLADLHKQGVLTDEEFSRQKARLLA
jgi:hypothetical protein